MEGPRYWTMESNESNSADKASRAVGIPLEALVDEIAGGVVGYLSPEVADEIVNALNGRS